MGPSHKRSVWRWQGGRTQVAGMHHGQTFRTRQTKQDHLCRPLSSAPAQTFDCPAGSVTGSSAVKATYSVEGPEPQLQRFQTTFARPRSYPPRRHRTQPLPGPSHLGRLTHGSPHSCGYFSSGRVAPPLCNQSPPGVDGPTPRRHVLNEPQPITTQHLLRSPAPRGGTGVRCLLSRYPLGKPRGAAELNYSREGNGNHLDAMLVRGSGTSGHF